MATLPAKLFTGTAVSVVGRVIGTVVSVLTVAVMTRSLVNNLGSDTGVAAYGVYAAVMAFLAIATSLADAGLYLIFTREASRDGADEKALLETAWFLRLITTVIAVGVALFVAFVLPYNNGIKIGVLIGVWGMVFQLGSQLFMGVFQKRLQLLAPALAEVFGRLAQFVAVVIFAYFGGQTMSFLWAFVIGAVATFLINIYFARRLVRFSYWVKPDKKIIRMFVREGWPMAVSLILSMVFFKIDSVMLALMKAPQDVAYYSLAYKVLESLLFFPAMIGGMLLPLFSRVSTKQAVDAKDTLKASGDLYLIGAIPLCFSLWVGAPWIVQFLGGDSFSSAVIPLRVLALALGMLFFGNLFGNLIVAIGEQKKLLYIYAFLTFFNIALNLILIPRFSFYGAAFVTLFTEFLSASLAALVLYRNKLFIGTERTFRVVLAGGLMVTVYLLPISGLLKFPLAISAFIFSLIWLNIFPINKIKNTITGGINEA